VSRLARLEPQALAHDKPLCASLDGFSLHAATRAGALDPAGREALLRYVLRPPVAQERVEQRPDGFGAHHAETVGEAAEVPQRSPGRGPPCWKSRVLRRQVLGDEDGGGGCGWGAGEEVA
jgi:hypothetical protein